MCFFILLTIHGLTGSELTVFESLWFNTFFELFFKKPGFHWSTRIYEDSNDPALLHELGDAWRCCCCFNEETETGSSVLIFKVSSSHFSIDLQFFLKY